MRYAILLVLFLLAACAGDDSKPRVVFETELGTIVVELEPKKAPVTAGNFLALVKDGHMDGGAFYRVVTPENDNGKPPISVIQGGLQDRFDRFDSIPLESTQQTGLLHRDGAISMARGGIDTASTEFFICVGDQPALDHGAMRNPDGQGFAVFGYVVDGMDVVRAIQAQDASALTDSPYLAGQLLLNPVTFTADVAN